MTDIYTHCKHPYFKGIASIYSSKHLMYFKYIINV